MNEGLYQKKGIIISRLALELLGKSVGDRIDPISCYQDKFEVSRGTIQNAFTFLKDKNAIELKNKGHLGTYITTINYGILQQYSIKDRIQGIMPLPYSKLYEGLATAFYSQFRDSTMNFNLAYTRGAEARIDLVVNKSYDFALCSKYAAQEAMSNGYPIEIAFDFGPQTYLSRHVLVFGNSKVKHIEDDMRIGIDFNSFDQRALTYKVVGSKHVQYVNVQSHQIITAIRQQTIDAGIWNYDEIVEHGYDNLNVVFISNDCSDAFSSAVIIVAAGGRSITNTLEKYIDIQHMKQIQQDVKEGNIIPSY